jgi:GT2 family glycosyltransferase
MVLYPNIGWNFDGYVFCQHLITWPVGNGSTLVVRREAALDIGGFDTEFRMLGCGGTEDLDFELRLAEKYKITCVPDYLVGYRRYMGSMSSDDQRMARAIFLTIDRAIKRNPNLPRICSKWARANAYRYVAVITRSRFKFAKYVLSLLFLDPRSCMKALDWKLRLWRRPVAREPQALFRFPNASVSPDYGEPIFQRRAEKLKHVDRILKGELG